MKPPRKTSDKAMPTESEVEWFRICMHAICTPPTGVREPDLIERRLNEKHSPGIDFDRPKDPRETQRLAAEIFCKSITTQRLAYLMRDDDLRIELRELLTEVSILREVLEEERPALVGLIDTDPPALRAVNSTGLEF